MMFSFLPFTTSTTRDVTDRTTPNDFLVSPEIGATPANDDPSQQNGNWFEHTEMMKFYGSVVTTCLCVHLY